MRDNTKEVDAALYTEWHRISITDPVDWIANSSIHLAAWREGDLPCSASMFAWHAAFTCSNAARNLYRSSLLDDNLSDMQHLVAVLFLLQVNEKGLDHWVKKAISLSARSKSKTIALLKVFIIEILLSRKVERETYAELIKKTLMRIRRLHELEAPTSHIPTTDLDSLLALTKRQLVELIERTQQPQL